MGCIVWLLLSFGYIYLLFKNKRISRFFSVGCCEIIYLLYNQLIVFMCAHSYGLFIHLFICPLMDL